MKKLYLSLALICYLQSQGQVYQQTFATAMPTVTNGVVTDANYVGDPPSSSQLTYLGAPTSGTVTVAGGTLNITTSSTSSRWAAVRSQNTTNYTGFLVTFDANLTIGSSGTSAPKFLFYAGSGFANSTATEAAANIHSGFGIKYQNSSYFYVSTLGGTDVTTQFSEGTSRTFTFATNNSGAALTYAAPDGTTETLADDKWDLWVGTTKVFDEQTATTAAANINSFKFGDINGSNGRSDMVIDNFSVVEIPVALPIHFSAFNVFSRNNQVQLNWSAQNADNVAAYTIERSVDSRSFTPISAITARVQTSYTYTDVSPLSGSAYYRIKATEKDGTVKYTNVLKVASAKQPTSISVLPNPVKGNIAQVQLNNFQKNIYTIELTNGSGQKVFSTSTKVEAGNSVQDIQLPAQLHSGVYYLSILSGEMRAVTSLIKQ
jgi:hypothetical protein